MRRYQLIDNVNRSNDKDLTLLEIINLSDFNDEEVDNIASMKPAQRLVFDGGCITIVCEKN